MNKFAIIILCLFFILPISVFSQEVAGYEPESNFETRLVTEDNSIEIVKYIGNNQQINIPSHINNTPVTRIAGGSFGRKRLTSVNIPNTVTYIGTNAFVDNYLTSITIPGSVLNIDNMAFARNTLTSLVISEGVTTIGNSAFEQNQLTSVVIAASVTSIGREAFSINPNLSNVTIGTNLTIRIGTFPNRFHVFYNANSRKGGKYTYSNEEWIFAL